MGKSLVALLLIAGLSGCATMRGGIEGVTVTEEERAECALTQKCAVWTEPQIVDLVKRAFREGYNRAMADKGKSS